MTQALAPTATSRTRRTLRWLPWVGLAVIVAVVLAVGSQRGSSSPTLEQRTMSIASLVKCPECTGETAAESNVPGSVAVRNYIHQQLAAGQDRSQILAELQSSFGTEILESPPAAGVDLVLWIFPVIAVLAAAVGLVLLFRRWRPAGADGVTDDDRRLVGALLGEEGPPPAAVDPSVPVAPVAPS